MRKEHTINDERKTKSDREHRTIVEVVLVRQVGVAEQRVRVDRLRSQRQHDDKERKRTTRDEKVLRLVLHDVVRRDTDAAEEAHDDNDGDTVAFRNLWKHRRARNGADIVLAARPFRRKRRSANDTLKFRLKR